MNIEKNRLSEYLEKAKAGDNEAWEDIYRAIYRDIHYICMEFLKNEDDAQDAEQDTFIKIYRNIDQLGSNSSFTAWAKKIATNTCMTMLRKRKNLTFSEIEAEMSTEDGDTTFDPEDANITFRPEEQADIKETSRLIRNMMAELPDEQRISLELLYGSELTIKEIAEAMECSENTVKSRLRYGKKSMEEKIEALRKNGTKIFAIPAIALIRIMCRSEIEAYAADTSLGGILQSVMDYCSKPHTVQDYQFHELMNRSLDDMDPVDVYNSAVERKKADEKAAREEKKAEKEAEKAEKKAAREAEEKAKKAEKAAEKAKKEEIKEAERAERAAKRAEDIAGIEETVEKTAAKVGSGLSTAGKAVIGVIAAAAVAVGGWFAFGSNQQAETPPVTTVAVQPARETAASIVRETTPVKTDKESVSAKTKAANHPPIKGERIEVQTFVTSGLQPEEEETMPETAPETKPQSVPETQPETAPAVETAPAPETQPATENFPVEEEIAESQNKYGYAYTFGYANVGGGARVLLSDHELTDEEIAAYEEELGMPMTVKNF